MGNKVEKVDRAERILHILKLATLGFSDASLEGFGVRHMGNT